MDTTWVSNIFSWVKQPIPYLLSICIVFGLLLFGPKWLTQDLGVNQFLSQYRLTIGIIFITTFIGLFAGLLSLTRDYIGDFLSYRLWLRKKIQRLHDLTPQEKQMLVKFFENNTRSCCLDITDGVVGGLVAEEIIYRSTNISKVGTLFYHNIQTWAWDYIRKNPQLLN